MAATVATITLLTACGPEAPACNSAEVTDAVLQMTTAAHNDHLKGYPAKAQELATFKLDVPTVIAYDDKLKQRNCKTVVLVQLEPARVKEMNTFMKTMENPALEIFDRIASFASAFGAEKPSALSDRVKADVLALRILSPSEITDAPIRLPLTYQIQKEEGSKQFITSTNVNVNGSIQYLRVAAIAQQAAQASEARQQQAQAKQAETDKLLASGNWRKAVYVHDFSGGRSDPYYCDKHQLYCFRARDAKDANVEQHYQLDAAKIGERGKVAIEAAARARTPVCLVGVQKTDAPNVFSALGYSTILNDKGEAVDCLPGAEKQDWNALVEQSRKDEAIHQASPSSAASPGSTAGKASTAGSAKGPEDLMSVVTRYEMCGEEAMCLYTAKGNTVRMNAFGMSDGDRFLLAHHVKSQTPLCLRQVQRAEGREFSAEALASSC